MSLRIISVVFVLVFALRLSTCWAAPARNPLDLCADARRLALQVSEKRGLFFKADLDCQVLGNEEFNQVAKQLAAQNVNSAQLAHEEIAFKLLGIIPSGYRYRDCARGNSDDADSVLYDSFKKRIIFRVATSASRAEIAQELVRALQDQEYDIRRLHLLAGTSDAKLALSALLDGDALTTSLAFETNCFSSATANDNADDTACIPPEPLLSIYLFAQEWGPLLLARLSVDEKNMLFRQPDLTSLAVMAKSFRGLKAETLSLESPPAGQSLLWEDRLGAYIVLALLRPRLGPRAADSAARAWRGDRIRLYGAAANHYRLEWEILTAGNAEAERSAMALREYFVQSAPLSPRSAEASSRFSIVASSVIQLERRVRVEITAHAE